MYRKIDHSIYVLERFLWLAEGIGNLEPSLPSSEQECLAGGSGDKATYESGVIPLHGQDEVCSIQHFLVKPSRYVPVCINAVPLQHVERPRVDAVAGNSRDACGLDDDLRIGKPLPHDVFGDGAAAYVSDAHHEDASDGKLRGGATFFVAPGRGASRRQEANFSL